MAGVFEFPTDHNFLENLRAPGKGEGTDKKKVQRVRYVLPVLSLPRSKEKTGLLMPPEVLLPSTEIPTSSTSRVGPRLSTASAIAPKLLSDDGMVHRRLRRARFRWRDWLLGSRQGQWIFMAATGSTQVLLGALLWRVFCEDSTSDYAHDWEGSIWFSWTMFFDPGTQTGMPIDDPVGIKTIAVVLSVFGFMFNLSFLGMVVDLVGKTLEDWQFHRSRIVLTGHILVLGWTGKTLFLLSELLHWSLTEGSVYHIVVMAERDENDMRKEISSHFRGNPKMARVASKYIKLRVGDPSDADHLERVSAGSAQDIIILGNGQAKAADLEVVRVVIALAALDEAVTGRVVAEVQRQEYAHALSGMLPGADGICARIAVNCLLCLMAVIPEVGFTFVSFLASDEASSSLYSTDVQQAHDGKSFREVSMTFPRAICIGIRTINGKVIFAPPADHVLRVGEKIVLVAYSQRHARHASQMCFFQEFTTETFGKAKGMVEGAAGAAADLAEEIGERAGELSSKAFSNMKSVAAKATNVFSLALLSNTNPHLRPQELDSEDTQLPFQKEQTFAERVIFVVVGWAADLPDMLVVLDKMSPPNSRIHVLSQKPISDRDLEMKDRFFKNVRILHYIGDLTSVHVLAMLPLSMARAVLILSESLNANPLVEACDEAIRSDSTCLTCVQMVSGLLEGRFADHKQQLGPNDQRPLIICEVLDPRADRVLARSQTLRQKAFFFRRGALETGLFHQAAISPTIFNSLVFLLASSAKLSESSSSDCEIEVVSFAAYAENWDRGRSQKALLGNRNSMPFFVMNHLTKSGTRPKNLSRNNTTDPEEGIEGWWSYMQLHEMVRERDGGILIGWLRYGKDYAAARSLARYRYISLVPDVKRHEQLPWYKCDTLIILRPRRSSSPASVRRDPAMTVNDENHDFDLSAGSLEASEVAGSMPSLRHDAQQLSSSKEAPDAQSADPQSAQESPGKFIPSEESAESVACTCDKTDCMPGAPEHLDIS